MYDGDPSTLLKNNDHTVIYNTGEFNTEELNALEEALHHSKGYKNMTVRSEDGRARHHGERDLEIPSKNIVRFNPEYAGVNSRGEDIYRGWGTAIREGRLGGKQTTRKVWHNIHGYNLRSS